MKTWLWQNGAWLSGATLPVTDRAARYGMSVFETIGISEGKALFCEQHLALLKENARKLFSTAIPSTPIPDLQSDETGMLRFYLTAGDGSPVDPVKSPRFFAIFENLAGTPLPDAQTAYLYTEPVTPFAHGSKTGNYWAQCTAQSAARDAGFDHAILSDNDEILLSAAFGNLFFVMDGDLCTPSHSLAVRPGVLRSWVMQQHLVQEIEFPAVHLDEADEIFITNSRLGVMPMRFGSIKPGPIGLALRDTCRREKLIP